MFLHPSLVPLTCHNKYLFILDNGWTHTNMVVLFGKQQLKENIHLLKYETGSHTNCNLATHNFVMSIHCHRCCFCFSSRYWDTLLELHFGTAQKVILNPKTGQSSTLISLMQYF